MRGCLNPKSTHNPFNKPVLVSNISLTKPDHQIDLRYRLKGYLNPHTVYLILRYLDSTIEQTRIFGSIDGSTHKQSGTDHGSLSLGLR